MKTFLQRLCFAIVATLLTSTAISQTITVSECSMNGWDKKENKTGKVSFAHGPATPPGGPGSAELFVGSNGDSYAELKATNLYSKTPLNTFTELKYSTYVQQYSSGAKAPYLVLSVDYDNNGAEDDVLYFDPAYQTAAYFPSNPQASIALNTWQTWNALSGGWWSKKGTGGATPGVGVKSLAKIIAAKPTARLVSSNGFIVRAGVGGGAWANFTGNADNVKIGVNNTTTTYDFIKSSNTVSLTCQNAITAPTDKGYCSAIVAVTAPSASGGCGAITVSSSRDDGQLLSAPYPKGTTTITWIATDANNNIASCKQAITVYDNQAPVLSLPNGVAAITPVQRGTDKGVCSYTIHGVEFDATAWDNCGATLRYNLTGATTASATSSSLSGVILNKGVTNITWIATDVEGHSVNCSFSVIVEDEDAPLIIINSISPQVLWSPNHKMVDITLDYTVTDNCGVKGFDIISISSNEHVNGRGDGNTPVDWEYVDAHHVRLRAERSGLSDGRVYSMVIEAVDDAGNKDYATVTVSVPHNQSGKENTLSVVTAPNPSSSSFTLSVKSTNSTDNITMTVSDLSGQVILKRDNVLPGETFTVGSTFEKGTYYASFKQGKSTSQVQLLKL